MGTSRLDWPAMRAAYVEGITVDGVLTWPTMYEVATQGGVTPQRLRSRAARESWTELREHYRHRLDIERQDAKVAELVRIGSDLDLRVVRAANTGIGIATSRLEEFGRMAAARTRALRDQADNRTAPTGPLPPAPPSEEVQILSRTVSSWYDVACRALGSAPPAAGRGAPMLERAPSLDALMADDEVDDRTAGILAVFIQAGVLPRDYGNGAGGGNGNGAGLAVLDVAGGPAQAGPEDPAQDDEVHPLDAG